MAILSGKLRSKDVSADRVHCAPSSCFHDFLLDMFAVCQSTPTERMQRRTRNRLVALGRTICGSDGKKDGEDESKSKWQLQLMGDNNVVWSVLLSFHRKLFFCPFKMYPRSTWQWFLFSQNNR